MTKTNDSKAQSKGRLEMPVEGLSSNVTRLPRNYIMGQDIEPYPGRKDWHILVGARPLPDWSRIDHDNPNCPAKAPTQQQFSVSKHKALLYKAMTAPLQVKFKVGMNLPQFINNVQDHIDMYSSNTWTYLPNSNESTKMMSVIKSYPKFLANVDNKIQKALELTEKFNKFDSENSKGTVGFILASVSPDLKNTQVTSTYYN